jgi:hypothetical protein
VVTTVDSKVYNHAGALGSITNTSALVVGAYSAAKTSSDWFQGTLDEVTITTGS